MGKYVFILAIGYMLIGCASTTPPQIVTVTETVEVKVPVKCEIPKYSCEFSGTGLVPAQKMLQCIILQKKIIDTCTVQK